MNPIINIQRIPDIIEIITDSGNVGDVKVSFKETNEKLSAYVTAKEENPKFIVFRWKHFIDRKMQVLGDNWERLQSDTFFRPLGCDRFYPWYFIATDGNEHDACGVMTRPNSLVSFQCDCDGVTGWFDVRCGGVGVELNGRELHIADIVSRCYTEIDSFDALCDFCKVMSPDPVLPKEHIYGGNNWYYAYGNSSAEEIFDDALLQSKLAGDNKSRPYMVIDDGWQINSCAGPWLPNEKFADMKGLTERMASIGVKAGIWVRFLHNLDLEREHPEYLIQKSMCPETYLDPSREEVLNEVREVIKRIKSWGFTLIKHDYSTFDMFNSFGFTFNGSVNKLEGWSFNDKSKTSAEIILNFYRTIYEECGEDTLIIGCNTFSHLCAGLHQINRVGDDTSGKYWDRTRAFGVNSLAFRLPQHNAFYAIDADCVGFLENRIPWELNSQWVDLLSKSGTPLFISCPNNLLTDEQLEYVKNAYKINETQKEIAKPLDWEYNLTPNRWLINGREVTYHWYIDNIPKLLTTDFFQPL